MNTITIIIRLDNCSAESADEIRGYLDELEERANAECPSHHVTVECDDSTAGQTSIEGTDDSVLIEELRCLANDVWDSGNWHTA